LKPLFRKTIAALATLGGLLLLYFEWLHYNGADSWLWIIIAALAAVLGLIELFAPQKPQTPY